MKKIKKYQPGGFTFPQAQWLVPEYNTPVRQEMARFSDIVLNSLREDRQRMQQLADRDYANQQYYERLHEQRDYAEGIRDDERAYNEQLKNRERQYNFFKDLELWERHSGRRASDLAMASGMEPGSYEWDMFMRDNMKVSAHDDAIFQWLKKRDDIDWDKLLDTWDKFDKKGEVPFFSVHSIEDFEALGFKDMLTLYGKGKGGTGGKDGTGGKSASYGDMMGNLRTFAGQQLNVSSDRIELDPIGNRIIVKPPSIKDEDDWALARDYIIRNELMTPQQIDMTFGDQTGFLNPLANNYNQIDETAWRKIAGSFNNLDLKPVTRHSDEVFTPGYLAALNTSGAVSNPVFNNLGAPSPTDITSSDLSAKLIAGLIRTEDANIFQKDGTFIFRSTALGDKVLTEEVVEELIKLEVIDKSGNIIND